MCQGVFCGWDAGGKPKNRQPLWCRNVRLEWFRVPSIVLVVRSRSRTSSRCMCGCISNSMPRLVSVPVRICGQFCRPSPGKETSTWPPSRRTTAAAMAWDLLDMELFAYVVFIRISTTQEHESGRNCACTSCQGRPWVDDEPFATTRPKE